MSEPEAAAVPEPKAEGHQRVYSLLVEGPEDFLGILAYSVYKQQKAEVIERFKDSNKLESELQSFYGLSKCESQRSFYKNQALGLARKFVDTAAGELIEESRTEITNDCRRKFESYKPSFWASVWAGVVAGIISILFLGLVIFFINSARYGFSTAVEKGFGVKITEVGDDDAPVSPPAGAPAQPSKPPAPAKH